MCTNVYGTSENFDFEVNGVTLENTGDSIKYQGVNLTMRKGLLTLEVGDRIKKFNISAYDVLLNSADLTGVVRCELIVKKCLPILLYSTGAFKISNNDVYILHISYRKIFRYTTIMGKHLGIARDLQCETHCKFIKRQGT